MGGDTPRSGLGRVNRLGAHDAIIIGEGPLRTEQPLSFDRAAAYFSGGVTPAGSGTCATLRVIDTRL